MRYCAVIFLLLMSNLGLADDWPQWMGPQRDNVWREEGIIEEFPANGPRILWRAEVAGGYSGLAVMNGSVYVTDYVTADNVKVANFEREKFTGIERIQCLSEKTGRQKWKFEYPVEYSISYPAGPRCTPIVHDGLVYFLGAEGNLHCLRAASGELVWSNNFKTDYNCAQAAEFTDGCWDDCSKEAHWRKRPHGQPFFHHQSDLL